MSAWDVERLVEERLRALLTDRDRILRPAVTADPRCAEQAADTARKLASPPALVQQARAIGVDRIALHEERLDIIVCERRLLQACGLAMPHEQAGSITLSIEVERVRRGHDVRLLIPAPAAADVPIRTDARMTALLREAAEVRDAVIERPHQNLASIAAELGKCRKRMMRLLPLAWVAPDVVQSILDGTQPATITHARLKMPLPACWIEQRAVLGIG